MECISVQMMSSSYNGDNVVRFDYHQLLHISHDALPPTDLVRQSNFCNKAVAVTVFVSG